MASEFKVGDRVRARYTLSWTLNHYEDYPLVVEKGELGTITRIVENLVYIEWDNDMYKKMLKCLDLSIDLGAIELT